MSQKFEVKVRADHPHQYAVGGRYNMLFGNPEFIVNGSRCPYKFHCTHLWGIDRDGTWIYSGIGEFDDQIWKVIAESMTVSSSASPQSVEDTGIPITLIDKGDN